MLGHLAGMRSKTAAAKGVRFSYINSSAKVVSDPLLLSTIVGNFLSIAMKYAPKDRVILGCRRAGDSLLITVSDNGIGLEDSRTAQLFKAFSQSDPQGEGLGLGLWIAGRTAALLGRHRREEPQGSMGLLFPFMCIGSRRTPVSAAFPSVVIARRVNGSSSVHDLIPERELFSLKQTPRTREESRDREVAKRWPGSGNTLCAPASRGRGE
jgi:hypothetical protein